MSESVSSKAAFVTGGSRGIGAETAKALALAGYDIAIGYQDPKKLKRVNRVIEAVESAGREAMPVIGDITTEKGRWNISNALQGWKPLNALILNAAGGLEKDRVDAYPDYALSINRDAQIALLDDNMCRLAEGSSVVFVTSDWSHKHGEVELPPFDYEPISSSKFLGEMALREKQDELEAVGSRLLVVTAGLVTGTYVGDAGIRNFPDFGREQASINNIISAQFVGERIAQAVEDPSLVSGYTLWIGADRDTFIDHSRLTNQLAV
jgi:NAD(P)-dependent dehydrogenase (short-subunit alcohol dehydrogenase family)